VQRASAVAPAVLLDGLLASTSYSPLRLNRDFAFRFSYVAWSYRKICDPLLLIRFACVLQPRA